MAVTINASTSAGAVTTADTSGILQLQTNGTAALTVDASQNVGIGTASPSGLLHVANTGTAGTTADNLAVYFSSANRNTNVYIKAKNTEGSNLNFADGDSDVVGRITYDHAGNSMRFDTNSTERMRIDSSGNVMVGTTSSLGSKFSVNAEMSLGTDGNNRGILTYSSGGIVFGTINASTTYFNSMTLKDGNLLVGTTSTTPNPGVALFPNGAISQGNSAGSTGYEFLSFRRSATQIGSVTQNGTTAVAYNTSSDYRLKENIAPMIGALATVAALRPVTYKWKLDGSDGQGFIAHELAEVVPDCVTGIKDAVETYTDKDGNEQTRPKYQGIDTSFLVATLTAAIQELKAIVDAQGAEIAALKGATA